LTVAELLISAGQHRHSVIAHWLAVRELFFSFLEARRTPFVSTEDALRHLISDHLDGNASAMLAEAYHLAIMAEWDEAVSVDEQGARRMRGLVDGISKALGRGVCQND
jgi:hypothetical protein